MDFEKVYDTVAQKYGVAATELTKTVQKGIDEAWKRPCRIPEQHKVLSESPIPDIEEIVEYICDALFSGK